MDKKKAARVGGGEELAHLKNKKAPPGVGAPGEARYHKGQRPR